MLFKKILHDKFIKKTLFYIGLPIICYTTYNTYQKNIYQKIIDSKKEKLINLSNNSNKYIPKSYDSYIMDKYEPKLWHKFLEFNKYITLKNHNEEDNKKYYINGKYCGKINFYRYYDFDDFDDYDEYCVFLNIIKRLNSLGGPETFQPSG